MLVEQLDKVQSYVDIGTGEGATLVCGSGRPESDGLRQGYFFEPTTLDAQVTDPAA